MLGKINSLFFKLIVILALLPLLPAVIAAIIAISPLLLVLMIFGIGWWSSPHFKPFQWICSLISGLASALQSVVGALFGWLPFGSKGARFMGWWDRWKLLSSSNEGFLVDGHKLRLTPKVSFQSVLTAGGMGRGKSSTFVIPNMFTLDNCSMVVSDTSGELYQKTSGALQKRGFQIRVLNLIEPLKSETYNPLANAKDFTGIAQTAEIIVRSALSSQPQDMFWNSGAEKIIRIFIQCLHNQSNNPDYRNLANLKYLINPDSG